MTPARFHGGYRPNERSHVAAERPVLVNSSSSYPVQHSQRRASVPMQPILMERRHCRM